MINIFEKQCTKCKEVKSFNDFHKDANRKYGIRGTCKVCAKQDRKKYTQQNKQKIKEFNKQYRKENKQKIKEYSKNYREENKHKRKVYNKKYYETNKNYYKQFHKDYYKKNKNKLKEYSKKYREENKEHYIEYEKKRKKIRRKYEKIRRKTDILYKLKCNLRNRTYTAFRNKGYSKKTKTREILGVDWLVCKRHIERQFKKDMNWHNYGDWHIDHIIPLASAKTEKELKKLCHYTNLQPLWAIDNIKKSNNILQTQIKLRI